jgi:hypothetical protein
MSKKEKIKSLKRTVKDLRAQVKKLKLAAGSQKAKSKLEANAPKAPPIVPKTAKTVDAPQDPKPTSTRIVPPALRHG